MAELIIIWNPYSWWASGNLNIDHDVKWDSIQFRRAMFLWNKV